jgi:hypothetical protein
MCILPKLLHNTRQTCISTILDTHRSRYILLLAFTVTVTFIFICKPLGISLYAKFQYPKAVESPSDSASLLSLQSHCPLNKQSFLYISRVMLLVYRKTNRQRLAVWNVCYCRLEGIVLIIQHENIK